MQGWNIFSASECCNSDKTICIKLPWIKGLLQTRKQKKKKVRFMFVVRTRCTHHVLHLLILPTYINSIPTLAQIILITLYLDTVYALIFLQFSCINKLKYFGWHWIPCANDDSEMCSENDSGKKCMILTVSSFACAFVKIMSWPLKIL